MTHEKKRIQVVCAWWHLSWQSGLWAASYTISSLPWNI